ncbi:MAG: 3-deoxy-manno-octulosonate cytidylyltransferase [Proteobacteria bacterium]|nr:3-deoxy-manno-octulosonate cytidylyltransferase [Pseudomonadota bacterium]
MRPAIVIPARYASSRFEGKPLAMIAGRPMIARVFERCAAALSPERTFVATDDERIAACCRAEGIRVVMTASDCLTGTDRVHQASLQIPGDLFVNVQGDEPLIEPGDVRAVIEAAEREPGTVVNAMCAITEEADFRSPNVPKVAAAPDGRLLYMSRAPIPTDKRHRFRGAMKQVCIYAFPRAALELFARAGRKTPIEEIEDIEILRLLELGHEVRMVPVSGASIAVDVPADVARVEAVLHARA